MMMAWLTLGFLLESLDTSGAIHTLIIGIVAAVALIRFKTHPAFVVIGALAYGGLIIP
jgi:chromate transporter